MGCSASTRRFSSHLNEDMKVFIEPHLHTPKHYLRVQPGHGRDQVPQEEISSFMSNYQSSLGITDESSLNHQKNHSSLNHQMMQTPLTEDFLSQFPHADERIWKWVEEQRQLMGLQGDGILIQLNEDEAETKDNFLKNWSYAS